MLRILIVLSKIQNIGLFAQRMRASLYQTLRPLFPLIIAHHYGDP